MSIKSIIKDMGFIPKHIRWTAEEIKSLTECAKHRDKEFPDGLPLGLVLKVRDQLGLNGKRTNQGITKKYQEVKLSVKQNR